MGYYLATVSADVAVAVAVADADDTTAVDAVEAVDGPLHLTNLPGRQILAVAVEEHAVEAFGVTDPSHRGVFARLDRRGR